VPSAKSTTLPPFSNASAIAVVVRLVSKRLARSTKIVRCKPAIKPTNRYCATSDLATKRTGSFEPIATMSSQEMWLETKSTGPLATGSPKSRTRSPSPKAKMEKKAFGRIWDLAGQNFSASN